MAQQVIISKLLFGWVKFVHCSGLCSGGRVGGGGGGGGGGDLLFVPIL
jgi:hypothetical protein